MSSAWHVKTFSMSAGKMQCSAVEQCSLVKCTQQNFIYWIKCVGRMVTQSMSKICNFWRLIVGDCDYAES